MVKLKKQGFEMGQKFTQLFASYKRIDTRRAGMEKSVWVILGKKNKVAQNTLHKHDNTIDFLPQINPQILKSQNIDLKG